MNTLKAQKHTAQTRVPHGVGVRFPSLVQLLKAF